MNKNPAPPPPMDLITHWACERYHTLPEPGAYFEQDYALMTRMAKLSNIYNALVRLKNLHGKDIHKLTDGERKILRVLVDLGLIFNG